MAWGTGKRFTQGGESEGLQGLILCGVVGCGSEHVKVGLENSGFRDLAASFRDLIRR